MKCVRYNTVHYDKPLLPLCVCFHNVKLDFTAKTARFARSRAASAQRPVRVGHTQATSYIRTHTTSHWKWCLLVCMTALVCIRRRRIWHHKPLSDNVSDAMCWVWLIGSVQQYQLVWDPTAIHKRERERKRGWETQSCDPYGCNTVRLHDSFPSPALTSVSHTHRGHSNKDLRASKNMRQDTNTYTWAETVRAFHLSTSTTSALHEEPVSDH